MAGKGDISVNIVKASDEAMESVDEPEKQKRELENLKADVKFQNICCTKKYSLMMEEKEEKFQIYSRFAFMSHTSLWYLSSKEVG